MNYELTDAGRNEYEALVRDARRYRWLAKNCIRPRQSAFASRGQELYFLFDHIWSAELEEAIDTAMEQAK